jgi:hypothetical protein
LLIEDRPMDYLERITGEWRDRAVELSAWVMTHMVNRTDVWGRYVHRKGDESTRAITAPFRDERGKVFLDLDSLRKHFRAGQPSGQLGVHSASRDLTSRWLAIDIDMHDPEDNLSVSPDGNLTAARGWRQALVDQGLDPLLMDSNGIGGFHLLVIFSEPMSTAGVHRFASLLVADYQRRGLDRRPEVFPDKPTWDRYGDWLRLPGRHHTRPHFTRVWNDEPFADSPWLAGHEAIDRILATRPAPETLLERLGIEKVRRTVCLDFDGVLHSYHSGWQGAEVIRDPPIHGTREAVARLRQHYRVVVYSARCCTPEGRGAVESWLRKHDIEVDEVCEHKPPALVYVDDRAIPFRGDWEEVIGEIRQFRK